MDILGISCFYHDGSASLLRDGVLIAAAEEERFTRKKHDSSFPINAIKFCLKEGRIAGGELDFAIFYEKTFLKFERILLNLLQSWPRSWPVFRQSIPLWLKDRLFIRTFIAKQLEIKEDKILFCEHHLSHAASCFYSSPFKEAAILTIDGAGEWATTTLGKGEGNKITSLEEIKFPHSLGLLYSAFTAFLGFEVNEGEYKVMGMAPYGRPKYVGEIRKLIDFKDDGSFISDMDYFSYHYSTMRTFSKLFEKLFGEPRLPKERHILHPYYSDIAASIQFITEEIILKTANHLYSKTHSENLCMAGGVALNSVANWKTFKEGPFKNIFIPPSAGDGGGSLGAALYLYHHLLNNDRTFILEHAYWGEKYENQHIQETLERKGVNFEKCDDLDKIAEMAAQSIAKGEIVGWFQGRFEYGPRALGHRSILADPRRKEMKEILNEKVKFREGFRPFAPSILLGEVSTYFDIPNPGECYPIRFMLFAAEVKQEKKNFIPAVVHKDGTSRLQAVTKTNSPLYYTLIKKFEEITGVPLVLNTSFNLRGEPIVNSPEDALRTFFKSGLDKLVIGNYIINRK